MTLPATDVQSGAAPTLIPVGAYAGKPAIALTRAITLIGSRSSANIRLQSSQVSKAHALVILQDGAVIICDLASRTHVLVNGEQVQEATLKEGDLVRIGRFTFQFKAPRSAARPSARRAEPLPANLEKEDGRSVPLRQRVTVIGHRSSCDVVINDPSVSTTHAAVVQLNGRRVIKDLGSRNGTYVNGRRIDRAELDSGDEVRIGGLSLRYREASTPAELLDAPVMVELPDLQTSETAAEGPSIPLDVTDAPAISDVEPPPLEKAAATASSEMTEDLQLDLPPLPVDQDASLAAQQSPDEKLPDDLPASTATMATTATSSGDVLPPISLEPPASETQDRQSVAAPDEPLQAVASEQVAEQLPAEDEESKPQAEAETISLELVAEEAAPPTSDQFTLNESASSGSSLWRSALSESAPADRALAEPTSAEPTSAEPTSAQATAAQPTPAQPRETETAPTLVDEPHVLESAPPPEPAAPILDVMDPPPLPFDETTSAAQEQVEIPPLEPRLPGLPLEATQAVDHQSPPRADEPATEMPLADVQPIAVPASVANEMPADEAVGETPIDKMTVNEASMPLAEPPITEPLNEKVEAQDLSFASEAPAVEPANVPEEIIETPAIAPSPPDEFSVESIESAPAPESSAEAPDSESLDSVSPSVEEIAPAPAAAGEATISIPSEPASEVASTTAMPTVDDAVTVEPPAEHAVSEIEASAPSEAPPAAVAALEPSRISDRELPSSVVPEPSSAAEPASEQVNEPAAEPVEEIVSELPKTADAAQSPFSIGAAGLVEPAPEPLADGQVQDLLGHDERPLAPVSDAFAPAEPPASEDPGEETFAIAAHEPVADDDTPAEPPVELPIAPSTEPASAVSAEAVVELSEEPVEDSSAEPVAIPSAQATDDDILAMLDQPEEPSAASQTTSSESPALIEADVVSDAPPSHTETTETAALIEEAPAAPAIGPAVEEQSAVSALPEPASVALHEPPEAPAPSQRPSVLSFFVSDAGGLLGRPAADVPATVPETEVKTETAALEPSPPEPAVNELVNEPAKSAIDPEPAVEPARDHPSEEPTAISLSDTAHTPVAPAEEAAREPQVDEMESIWATSAESEGTATFDGAILPDPDPLAETSPEESTASSSIDEGPATEPELAVPETSFEESAPSPAADLGEMPPPAVEERSARATILAASTIEALRPEQGEQPRYSLTADPFDSVDVFSKHSIPVTPEEAAELLPRLETSSQPSRRGRSARTKAVPPRIAPRLAQPQPPRQAVPPTPAVEKETIGATAVAEPKSQPAPALKAPVKSWGPLAAAVAGTRIEAPAAAAASRKKLVPIMLVLMLLVMAVAALVIWKLVLPRTSVQGELRFDRLGALPPAERQAFIRRHLSLVPDANRQVVSAVPASAKPWFNEAPRLSSEWIDESADRGVLRLTSISHDRTGATERVTAALQAIYGSEPNQTSLRLAAALPRQIEQRQRDLAALRALVDEAASRRQALELQAAKRPAEQVIDNLQAAERAADAKWTRAISERKARQSEIEQLQTASAADVSKSAADDRSDSELAQLQDRLTEINTKLAAAKSTAQKSVDEARNALNASIDEFQSSLKIVQGMMSDNPVLSAHVAAAQKLHEAAWKLQGDLIERQETQQRQLVELSRRLDEQVKRKRQEAFAKDEDLKQLARLIESKSREKRQAETAGMVKDAARLGREIEYINERIAARKMTLGNDTFYNEATAGVAALIDSLRKQLKADRDATEKMMAELESTFRESSPEVQNLPRTQQTIAAKLDEKARVMKSARKAWTDAVAAQDAASSAELKQLQADAAALQEMIAIRRKIVTDQRQQELSEQQQAAIKSVKESLAAAEVAEATAQEAYTAARRTLDEAMSRVREAEAAGVQARKLSEKDEPALLAKLKTADAELKAAQASIEATPQAHPPMLASVTVDASRRAYFTTIAVLSIGAFFALAIYLIPTGDAPPIAVPERSDTEFDEAALAV